MRRMFLVVAVSACNLPTNFPDPKVGMRFTSANFGRDHSARTRHVDMPFQLKSEGVNGTALLLGFLQTVEPSGATYISEVSYSLQLVYRGVPVECVSKIVVEDGTQPPPPPAAPPEPRADDEYTTRVAPWQPEQADRVVTERELACRRAAMSSIHKKNAYDVEYNAEVKRNLDPQAWSTRQPLSEIEPRIIETAETTFYDACKLDPATRMVHRYEHFLAAKFAPPDLDSIRKRYSDSRLVEAPPTCHRIDRVAGMRLRQHITADLHYVGGVELRETIPDSLGSYR